MRIGNLVISYPFGHFDVLIKHFTSRKSTAIEWGILELAKEAQKNTAFSDVSLSDVFEHILKINDPDLLIKPCLIALEDLDAIKVNNLCDEISLKELKLSDVKLTNTGEEMQAKGLLPGKDNEETVKFTYDLLNNSIAKHKKEKFTEEPLGYKVEEIDSDEEIAFPAIEIRDYLESCKKANRYQWLQETTNIKDLELEEVSVNWKNETKLIDIELGTVIKLANIKENDKLNSLVFESEIVGEDDERISTDISPLEIENDIANMFMIKDLNEQIRNTLNSISENKSSKGLKISPKKRSKNNTSIIFIDNRFKEESLVLKDFNVNVIYNADEFKLDIKNRGMTIELPIDIFNSGCVLLCEDENIFVGKASLYNNFGCESFKLGYKKAKPQIDEKEVICKIIDEYMDIDPKIISLGAAKNQEIVLSKLKVNVESLASLKEKIKRIDSIKHICKDIFDRKIELTQLHKDILFNSLIKDANINSFEDLKKIHSEYLVYEPQINNFEVSNYVRDKLIDLINYTQTNSDILDIYNLLFQENKGKKVEQLKRLYTYPVVRSIYKKLKDKQQTKLEQITSIEGNYRKMIDILTLIESYLPNIDLSSNLNNRIILENIVENRKNITQIKNACLNWGFCVTELSDTVDLELLQQDCALYEIFDNMKKIRDELAIFINDESIKYQNVLVIDTCSILDNSSSIADLMKKHLVVIPTIVLKELEKHKYDEDEKKAYKAREANRKIEELSSKLRIENANLDLVPRDLTKDDEDNADNRVLAIAIKYIAKKVILVTEDINLRNKAISQNITTMKFEDICKDVKNKEKVDKIKDKVNKNNLKSANGKDKSKGKNKR